MATHSSILAWRISWIEEPGRLQCTGSQSLEATGVSAMKAGQWLPLTPLRGDGRPTLNKGAEVWWASRGTLG